MAEFPLITKPLFASDPVAIRTPPVSPLGVITAVPEVVEPNDEAARIPVEGLKVNLVEETLAVVIRPEVVVAKAK